jgi:hypothetical protein
LPFNLWRLDQLMKQIDTKLTQESHKRSLIRKWTAYRWLLLMPALITIAFLSFVDMYLSAEPYLPESV